jgi:hypothetical protein
LGAEKVGEIESGGMGGRVEMVGLKRR